jgi:hypothetical protein
MPATNKLKQAMTAYQLGIEEPTDARKHYASDHARAFVYQCLVTLAFYETVERLSKRTRITDADRRYLDLLENAANTFSTYCTIYQRKGIKNPVSEAGLSGFIATLFEVSAKDAAETAEKIIARKRAAEEWLESLPADERAAVLRKVRAA